MRPFRASSREQPAVSERKLFKIFVSDTTNIYQRNVAHIYKRDFCVYEGDFEDLYPRFACGGAGPELIMVEFM